MQNVSVVIQDTFHDVAAILRFPGTSKGLEMHGHINNINTDDDKWDLYGAQLMA